MGKKKQQVLTQDKRLKGVLRNYVKSHDARVADFGKMLQKIGIPMPTELERFDGKATFYTKTNEKITIADDIEDYIPHIIVKQGNVQKCFKVFFHHSMVDLESVTVENGGRKVEIYKGAVAYQIEMQGESFKISSTKELDRYIEQLNCYTEPLKVWCDIKQMIR